MHQKVLCANCGWHGDLEDVDHVDDPRPRPGLAADRWQVCPQCRAPEHIRIACEEGGCWKESTCGVSTPAGYRRKCSQHFTEWMKEDAA
jgi:hypothetical protein